MKRRKKHLGADSGFELRLKTGVLKDIEHHPAPIVYMIPESTHKYYPDFIIKGRKGLVGPKIYIEAKGRFRTNTEAEKYTHIREYIGIKDELVFLFQYPYTPMPGAKRRKDGTFRTHAEWAESNRFKWYTKDTIHVLLEE